ncbi:MAG: hypothetical protein WBD20_09040 [Pirellulaceae bacterium]
MNFAFLSRILLVAATLCATYALATPVQAGCGIGCKTSQCCPKCNHVCKLTAEKVDVEKSCFEVESDYICIPKVVFPWQRPAKRSCNTCTSCDGSGCKSCSACPNNGAKIRKIKVLKTKKYECPECEYTWSAEEAGGCGCSSGNCAGSSCAGSSCAGSSCAGSSCAGASCDGCASCSAASYPPAAVPYTEPATMYQHEAPALVPAPVYADQVPPAADYYAPAPQN